MRDDDVMGAYRCESTYRSARDPLGRWPEMDGKQCQSPEGHPGAHVWHEAGIDSLGPLVSWQ